MATATETVADNVRAEVARARLTQARIAHTLGVSQQAVSSRLNGRTPFALEELVSLAALLDVPLSTLLGQVAA